MVFALFLLSLFLVFSFALSFHSSLLFSSSYLSHTSFCFCSPPPAAPPDRAAGSRTRQPENSKRAHFRAPALQTPPKFHERTPRERKKKENCGGKKEKSAKFWAPHPSGLHPSKLHPSGSTLRGPTFSGLHFFWVWASTLRGPTFSRFGPPPFGAPTFGAPTFGAHPSGPQPSGPHFFWVWASTLGASTLWGPHPLWSKNSTSKNWPKSKVAEVEIGRSRIGRTRKKKLAEVEIGRSRSRSNDIVM